MSPALTRDHTQDVVDVTADCAQASLDKRDSLLNTLSKTIIYTEPFEQEDDLSTTLSKLPDKTNCPQLSDNSLIKDSSANGCNSSALSDTDVNFSNSRNASMTPRMGFSCVATTAAGLKTTKAVETNGLSVSAQSVAIDMCGSKLHEHSNVNGLAMTSKLFSKVEVPKISDLNDQHNIMEQNISNTLKRISHLQSILAYQHSKRQLNKFLGNQRFSPQLTGKNVSATELCAENCMAIAPSSNAIPVVMSLNGERCSSSSLSNPVTGYSIGDSKQSEPLVEGGQDSSFTLSSKNGDKKVLKDNVSGMSANLKQLQKDIDSDATDSSSGEDTDSDSEDVMIEEKPQVTSSGILATGKKKPCWRWARDRALVISRWTWLQAQVSDLEYRIRQHGEIHKHLRSRKTPLLTVPMPAQTGTEDASQRAARCIPFPPVASKRHRFVRVSQAAALGPKARRPIILKCQCLQNVRRCAICTGHHNYAKPQDIETLPRRDRISQLEGGFHPVLSFARDVNPAVELEEVMNSTDRKLSAAVPSDKKLFKTNKKLLADAVKKQKLALKLKVSKDKKLSKAKKRKLANLEVSPPEFVSENNKKKKSGKLNSKVPSSSGKRVRSMSHSHKWDEEEELVEQYHAENSLSLSASAGSDHSKSTHKRMSAYDIDDIVIPYTLAAATRVEKLQYKEIDTPRWRECGLNGTNVHEQMRRRSSSMSVPLTPITPSVSEEMSLTVANTLSINTTSTTAPPVASTVDVSAAGAAVDDVELSVLTPLSPNTPVDSSLHSSERSSSASLGALEVEDISDSRYISRHCILEANEKSRYMNFVSARRTRTHSVNMTGGRSLCSPGASSMDIAQQETNNVQFTNSTTDISNNSLPLSASHDVQHMREELSSARKRSLSFTGSRLRKEVSVDVHEEPEVLPWTQRTFPLSDDDVKDLNSEQKVSTRRSSFHSSSRWKVISTEEEHPSEQKSALILKFTKS